MSGTIDFDALHVKMTELAALRAECNAIVRPWAEGGAVPTIDQWERVRVIDDQAHELQVEIDAELLA